MTTSIEMKDLKATGSRTTTALADDALSLSSSDNTWAWISAVVLALFSIGLLVFPRLLLFLAEPTGGRSALTALEKHLALHLGIILGVFAVAIIAVLPNESPTGLHRRTDPAGHPFLTPLTVAALLMAFLSYDDHSIGSVTTAVVLGYGVVGVLGLWMLVFSGQSPISRTTGADKHTSAFLFGNKNAASVRKKLWKTRNQSD